MEQLLDRLRIGNWIESIRIQNIIIVLILINAVTLGIETSPALVKEFGEVLHLLDQLILT